MRKVHRWAGAVFAVLLLIMGASGAILQLQRLKTPLTRAQQEALDAGRVISSRELRPALAHVEAAAVASGRPVHSVRLSAQGPGLVGTVEFAGGGGRPLLVDASTGAPLRPHPEPSAWDMAVHRFIKELHTGEMFGSAGRLLGLVVGSALVVLCATGLAVYVDLFRRRLRIGKKQLFWS